MVFPESTMLTLSVATSVVLLVDGVLVALWLLKQLKKK